ncbi:MAG: toll/interleukin-1 receptor domain-containing protein, partial [Candidatus Binataceae bacterium]
MNENGFEFEIPKNIERHLAVLSKIYEREREPRLQQIVVNSQTRIRERWDYDNLDGGTYGHALYLLVPGPLFAFSMKEKEEFEEKLQDDLRKVANVPNEYIARVFLELDLD